MNSLPSDRTPTSSKEWFVHQSSTIRRRAEVAAAWRVRQNPRSISGMLTGNIMNGVPGCSSTDYREPFQNGGEGCWVGFDVGLDRRTSDFYRWRARPLYSVISSQIIQIARQRRDDILLDHIGSQEAINRLHDADFDVGILPANYTSTTPIALSPLVPGLEVDINLMLCGMGTQAARFLFSGATVKWPDAGVWRCNAVTAATDILILVPDCFVSAPVVLSELERFEMMGHRSVTRPVNADVMRRLTVGCLLSDIFPSLKFGLKIQQSCQHRQWLEGVSAACEKVRIKNVRDCLADPIVAAGYGGYLSSAMVDDYLSGPYMSLEPSFGFQPYHWLPPKIVEFCDEIVKNWSFSKLGHHAILDSSSFIASVGNASLDTKEKFDIWWQACRWPKALRVAICPRDPNSARFWNSDIWADF